MVGVHDWSVELTRGDSRRAAWFVVGTLALVAAASSPALSAKPPPPKAGAVPIELEHLAEASGPGLRAGGSDAPELDLAGRRVRFVASVEELSQEPGESATLALSHDGSRVVLRLPGPLEFPERLDPSKEWEVIVRIDRPETLKGGIKAFAVGPDILVKTPGPPGELRRDDVVLEVLGSDFFDAPALDDFESAKPLYGLKVLVPGKVNEKFMKPGPVALARSRDSQGREVFDSRSMTGATDGSQRAVRCVYRIEGGHLRNIGYGSVDLAPDGSRQKEVWVDFEKDTFRDTWSARRKPFPQNTYASGCIATAISGFPFGHSNVVRFWVFGGSGMPAPLYAFVDGVGGLDMPGGQRETSHVRVGLDVRRVARQIDLPEEWRRGAEAAAETWYAGDAEYWLAASRPRHILRFEGPLGPSGSPKVRIDRLAKN